jgi:RNA polymerase sigma-70 factor (ECF subfamily)
VGPGRFKLREPALDELFPQVYAELRRLAARALRDERANHTLQPTALVHEAYLRLARSDGFEIRSRTEFLVVAARVMRRVLVDHARARRSGKRGGDPLRVTLDVAGTRGEPAFDLLALDEALTRLMVIDEQQVKVIELRYLAGLSVKEVAETLGISPTTVKRETAMGQAWLFRELSMGVGDGG